jgi:hypothetical protein
MNQLLDSVSRLSRMTTRLPKVSRRPTTTPVPEGGGAQPVACSAGASVRLSATTPTTGLKLVLIDEISGGV